MPVAGTQPQEVSQAKLPNEPFTEVQLQSIRSAIQNKYRDVAKSADGFFKYTVGRQGAVDLGYASGIIDEMPAGMLDSFCGVGNPFGIESISPGSIVLDIGCGAGFDMIVAHSLVGETGRVCGIDMTAEMLERAESNFAQLGITELETQLVDSAVIPYEDNTFDVVISNGVINLSAEKHELFKEILRVLKPGGRLQFADMVLDKPLPPGMSGNLDAWAQ